MVELSPSILNSDYLALSEALGQMEAAGVDMVHLDVMDGMFVPNISFGVPVIRSIRAHTRLPLDVHLMIEKPHRYLKEFAAVSDYLGFHYEAGSPVRETLREIRALHCRSCLTIKPATDPEVVLEFLEDCDMVLVMSVEPGFGGQAFLPSALDKLSFLRAEIDRRGLATKLEVDGGINAETAPKAVAAGADVLVAGNYLFSAPDLAARAKEIKLLG